MRWIRQWLERRHAAKAVTWKVVENECGWSPRKAAEKQFVEMYTKHHMELFRIQFDANLREIERQHGEAVRSQKLAKFQHALQQAQIADLRSSFNGDTEH